jgi:hypothetical protein
MMVICILLSFSIAQANSNNDILKFIYLVAQESIFCTHPIQIVMSTLDLR